MGQRKRIALIIMMMGIGSPAALAMTAGRSCKKYVCEHVPGTTSAVLFLMELAGTGGRHALSCSRVLDLHDEVSSSSPCCNVVQHLVKCVLVNTSFRVAAILPVLALMGNSYEGFCNCKLFYRVNVRAIIPAATPQTCVSCLDALEMAGYFSCINRCCCSQICAVHVWTCNWKSFSDLSAVKCATI